MDKRREGERESKREGGREGERERIIPPYQRGACIAIIYTFFTSILHLQAKVESLHFIVVDIYISDTQCVECWQFGDRGIAVFYMLLTVCVKDGRK